MLETLMDLAKEISPATYANAKWALDWNQMDVDEVVDYLIRCMAV